MKKYLFLSFLTLFGYVGIAAAATPQILGEYGDWIAYYYRDNAGPVCYMASTPKKDEGKYSKRGDIFVVVTHRPNEKSYDVVNINAGYTYKKNAQVEAMKDKDDKDIVAAMKRGSRMIVDGVSSRGTKTKDTYSLTGFTSAYKAISNKCK